MTYLTKPTGLLALMVLALISVGCGQSGISPDLEPSVPKFQELRAEDYANHNLWGMWEITYDIDALSASMTPVRDLQAHFNITGMLLPPNCGDCVKVQVNAFNPVTRILDLYVTLKNSTSFSGHDVRGIVYTDDYGHLLVNDNCWTALYDIPGGQNINPFRAYLKTAPKRLFPADSEATENYQIYIPTPPAFNQIKFAVDVSWPDNCKEPRRIDFIWVGPLFAFPGSQGGVRMRIYDEQEDENAVRISVPAITGEEFVDLTKESNGPWSGIITNATGAPPGEYQALITTTSTGSGTLALYKYITVNVWPQPEEPVDLTPAWFQGQFSEVFCTDNGYAFVGTGELYPEVRLHIYDISDPTNPQWVSYVEWGYDQVTDVVVKDGLAFITTYMGGFVIVDISQPDAPVIIAQLGLPASDAKIAIGDGYAYLSGGSTIVIDVDPPEEANVVETIPVSSHDIAYWGGYAYLIDDYGGKGFTIVDVSIPGQSEIINSILLPLEAQKIEYANGYVYIAAYSSPTGEILVLDVDPPEEAPIIKTLYKPGNLASDMYVKDNYLYCTDEAGMSIVDVTSGAGSFVVQTVSLNGDAQGVSAANGYAYVANFQSGLDIIDVSPPENASLVNELPVVAGVSTFDFKDGLLAIGEETGSLALVSATSPVDFTFLSRTADTYGAADLALAGNIAYLLGDNQIQAFSIDPPNEPLLLDSIGFSGPSLLSFTLAGQTIYIPNSNLGLIIVDVSDPTEISHLTTLTELQGASTIAINGDIACLGSIVADGFPSSAHSQSSLQILDINPPGNANVIKSIDLPNMMVGEVAWVGNYIYASGGDAGTNEDKLIILDATVPTDLHIVNSLSLPAYGNLVIDGNLGYMPTGYGVFITDISDPANPQVLRVIGTVGSRRININAGVGFALIGDGKRLHVYDLS